MENLSQKLHEFRRMLSSGGKFGESNLEFSEERKETEKEKENLCISSVVWKIRICLIISFLLSRGGPSVFGLHDSLILFGARLKWFHVRVG